MDPTHATHTLAAGAHSHTMWPQAGAHSHGLTTTNTVAWPQDHSNTTFSGGAQGNGTWQAGHIGFDHTNASGNTSWGCGGSVVHGPTGTHVTGGGCHIGINW